MYKYLRENWRKALFFPLIVYWIILFIGTSLPSDHISDIFAVTDKLKHFSAYLVLAFLINLNFHFQDKNVKLAQYSLIITFFLCVTYGMLDELHQMWIPNRSAELMDWLADSLGSIVGILVSTGFISIIKNKYEVET